MIKVTYLAHSGFSVEYREFVLVFDYYRGILPEFEPDKKPYVFASHVHEDHFKRKIFDWASRYTDIHYILSDDIQETGPGGRVLSVGADEELVLEGLKIRTLKSTDEGVAFLVNAGDKVIYHAGDLNWWHWEEEDDRTWNEPMRQAYQQEIKKLSAVKIDVAFVPLDMRQGKQFFWGLDYFMRHTDTACVFPMHMCDYKAYDRLIRLPESEPYRDKVMHITRTSQEFLV